MKEILLAGAGGFLGSVFRFLMCKWFTPASLLPLPWGTLAVNLGGCFLIGIFYGLISRNAMGESWRIFLAIGICGGFTTFSAFSSETFSLLQRGFVSNALAYLAISVGVGLAATFAGWRMMN